MALRTHYSKQNIISAAGWGLHTNIIQAPGAKYSSVKGLQLAFM
jgi:hypothetical protein